MFTLPRCVEVKCWTIYLDSWPDIKWNPFSSLLHGQRRPIVSQVLRAEMGHRDNPAQSLNSTNEISEAQGDVFWPSTLSLHIVSFSEGELWKHRETLALTPTHPFIRPPGNSEQSCLGGSGNRVHWHSLLQWSFVFYHQGMNVFTALHSWPHALKT